MVKGLQEIIERAKKWPAKVQEELIEVARGIDARRGSTYVLTDEERAAVARGREQARKGKFVSEKKMRAFWKKHRVI
ncbi:hypothetical protein A2704_03430 [Candidatus Kaiserbacteria bacterium RIFCSPHIGHO2_01_FULL_54_36b]|uniref:Uncharacterized protein n=1 Tax=Candidatus Kaiserbacteria bacterium RIFCSPHIGHO2_01_FULL_54_36b TaxID=1798483 RepID=A0A1F6CQG8_9BACT|nr:MAG: hypothetical protein A2704_03430 [Candidatus Kaiserbacteria bacterium RIFCSPHIGHO2_01_FULL_54_36b]